MARYQYQIIGLGMFNAADRMVKAFTVLGSSGWELVTIYDKSSNWFGGMEKGFALFKREVEDGAEPDGPWATFVQAGKVGQPDGASNDPNWGAW